MRRAIGNLFIGGEIKKNIAINLKKNERQKNKCPANPIRILIVEDEAITRETFADILKDYGFRVETAKSGRQAIEKTKKEFFDVAIIDIILGEISGVDTLKIIKSIHPLTICIMMTAYCIENALQESLKAGALTCFYKPFDVGEVIRLIKKTCDEGVH